MEGIKQRSHIEYDLHTLRIIQKQKQNYLV